MNYAAEADMLTHFGPAQVLIAADRDGDGTADTGVVTDALADASEEIDSYLAARYTLPLVAPIPGVLVRVCCDIAMYRMSIDGPSMTDEKRVRYEDAIKWLTNLAKGIVTLGVEEDTTVVSTNAVTLASSSEPRLFTRTMMTGLM
jgi:phage gp36-like protein